MGVTKQRAAGFTVALVDESGEVLSFNAAPYADWRDAESVAKYCNSLSEGSFKVPTWVVADGAGVPV